jgi:hypothetical protein
MERREMAKERKRINLREIYEKDLREAKASLKAAEEERARLERQWSEKYIPVADELIAYAKKRGHDWLEFWNPDQELGDLGITFNSVLAGWLYPNAPESARMRTLNSDIKRRKKEIREAQRGLRLYKPTQP